MTSSLVGSEMCIRDRGGDSKVELVGYWDTCQGLSEFLEVGCPGCQDPVSYTHLTLPTICSV
eukprot:372032-Prorocentrum_lima.AAC.1